MTFAAPKADALKQLTVQMPTTWTNKTLVQLCKRTENCIIEQKTEYNIEMNQGLCWPYVNNEI